MAGHGFHAGEVAVQQRAGVSGDAARLAGMLAAPDLRGGAERFLADRTFAALTARDAGGRLWISPLTGDPGFLEVADETTLRVHGRPAAGDPLHDVPAGQAVGLIAVDFARRRRIRVNGTLAVSGASGLVVEAEQAFGNCPQYIQQRVLDTTAHVGSSGAVRRGAALGDADVALVRNADTFLLGTTHPDRGSDASHRGGAPGFVRVENAHELWWPDYPGNNLFNSLGNIAVDPAAALLFLDFATGTTLHLSGTAVIDWEGPPEPAADDRTGRRVRFSVEATASGSTSVHADDVVASPWNPPLTAP